MPTPNISLTPEQGDFVEKVVKAGEYKMRAKPSATRCAAFNSAVEKMR